MAEVELDNVRENGVKMSVETKQNNLRDYILSWSSQKGNRRFLRNAQNIVNICFPGKCRETVLYAGYVGSTIQRVLAWKL